MVEQGETWTLSDGNAYTVVSIVKEDERKYVYLINRSDVGKFIIAEYTGEEVLEIESPELLETLIMKFNEDLKNSLPRLVAEDI